MNRRDDRLDTILDEALGQIRNSAPDAQTATAAADRVWQQLQQEQSDEADDARRIENCDDFQQLIVPHLRGELTGARKLLVEDHLGGCLTCRRVLKQAREQARRPRAVPAVPSARRWYSTVGWRVAAAAVIFLAFVGVSFRTDVFSYESGGMIRIESIEGELYHFTDQGTAPVTEGAVFTLNRGEGLRTAKGSNAVVKMADDSQIEMRERSQIAVLERKHLMPGRRNDGVIDLDRGSIIVEASDQGSGHLFVDTTDCEVAVTGTVFAVNSGMKGSRVSVIEGEVQVNYAGTHDVLQPGEQTTTSDALSAVPVEDEIAWSQKRQHYVALLQEMRALTREIDQVLRPGLRYDTDLLAIAPRETGVYVAMPNVSEGLGEAYEILQDRVANNPVLAQWWNEQMAGTAAEEFEQVFDKIRDYGEHLGPEIVLSVQFAGEHDAQPLFLARVTNSAGFIGLLESDIAELTASGESAPISVIQGDLPPSAPQTAGVYNEMFFWADGDLLAVSPSFDRLLHLDAVVSGAFGSLSGTAFHEHLATRYADGVEWLVGVDLERIIDSSGGDITELEEFGFSDLQFVIAERRQSNDETTENRAVLTFSQPRRRMAAWLADPAPIGSMDYISPDANVAVAFVMKDMGTLVDELFDMIGSVDDNFKQHLDEFESTHGIDIRRDIAAPLGGEFAMALDGPVLPSPSWKLIMEVYDPVRLERSLETLVEQFNEASAEMGIQGLTFASRQTGGRTYLVIHSLDTGLSVHMVFDNGYVIAGPSTAIIDRALQTRASGITLTDSPKFTSLLPRDGQVNFSGVFYHDLAPVLGPLADAFSGAISQLAPEEQGVIAALTQETKPNPALVYGEPSRISVISISEGGLLGSGLNALSGVGGLLGMQQSLLETLGTAASDSASIQREIRVN